MCVCVCEVFTSLPGLSACLFLVVDMCVSQTGVKLQTRTVPWTQSRSWKMHPDRPCRKTCVSIVLLFNVYYGNIPLEFVMFVCILIFNTIFFVFMHNWTFIENWDILLYLFFTLRTSLIHSLESLSYSLSCMCVTCISWMLLAAQPNRACHLTPKPLLQDPPASLPPCIVAMAARIPRHTELWDR